MIFHTAADKIYFDLFFKRWHQSIKRFNPTANFSLRYVGDPDEYVYEYCYLNNIFLTEDNITLLQIMKHYDVTKKDALGYYALSRWLSIPNSDNVCVADVDLIQLNPMDIDFKKIFETYQYASIARKKLSKSNLMMIFFVPKQNTDKIRAKAKSLLDKLTWDTDTRIVEYIEKTNEIYVDYGLFQLDNLIDLSVPDHVKFGYFSNKPIPDMPIIENENIKKVKYDLFYSNRE